MAMLRNKNTLSAYPNFVPLRDSKADAEQGMVDGMADLPPSDQVSLGCHELSIVAEGQMDMARLRQSQADDRQSAKTSAATHMQARLERSQNEQQELINFYDQKQQQIRMDLGEQSRLAQQQDSDLFDAEQNYNNLRRDLGREIQVRMIDPLLTLFTFKRSGTQLTLTPYFVMMAILSAIEVLINSHVIGTLIGQLSNLVISFAVAAIFGGVLIYLAHLVGLYIRQGRVPDRPFHRWRLWLGVPLIVLAVGMVYWEVSAIRMMDNGPNQAIDGARDVFNGVVSLSGVAPVLKAPLKAAADGVANMAKDHAPHLGLFPLLDGRAFTYFMLNVLSFLGGAWLSYRRHDAHPDYERLFKLVQKATRAKDLRIADHDAALAMAEDRFQRQMRAITATMSSLEARISQHEREISGNNENFATQRDQIIAAILRRILAYQTANTRSRSTRSPEYFGEKTREMVSAMLTDQSQS